MRGGVRRFLAGLLALEVVTWSLAVRSEPASRVHLRYTLGEGAARCPAEAAVRDSVAARLGYEPWADRAPRTIIVAVGLVGQLLRARVELRGVQGKIDGVRELSSSRLDCQELSAAVELAISIAIDPLSFGRAPAPPLAESPRPPQAQAPVEGKAPPLRSPVTSADRALHVAASVGGHVAIGSAPSIAGGVTLQGRLRWRRLSLGIEGRVDLPAYRDVPGGQISSSLLLGGLLGCFHYRWLAGCALVTAGALRAAGHGIPNAESATLAYAAGGIRLGVELPIFSIIALRLHGDLLAPFTRITLRESDTRAEIWSTPPLSGAFGLAIVGAFL
jgi:hypothetical protein